MEPLQTVTVECPNCGTAYIAEKYVGQEQTCRRNRTGCLFCPFKIWTPDGVPFLKERSGPPRDLKFDSGRVSEIDLPMPKTRLLIDPVDAFRDNVWRLDGMLRMPAFLAAAVRLQQAFEDEASIRLTGNLKIPVERVRQPDYSALVCELIKQYVSAVGTAALDRMGMDQVVNRASLSTVWPGLSAILVARLTGTWTAFEVLAGDLWEAAINAHPRELSALKGTYTLKDGKEKKAVNAPDAPDSDDDAEKWINTNLLARLNYDLSKHMGTAIKHRFNFSVLDDIRRAYFEAFRRRGGAIKAAIMDSSIDALACVRHVLVHKAGIADVEFVRKAKKLGLIPGIIEGDRVPVNGELVEQLVAPVITQCTKLIEAVDDWIDSSSKKGISGGKSHDD